TKSPRRCAATPFGKGGGKKESGDPALEKGMESRNAATPKTRDARRRLKLPKRRRSPTRRLTSHVSRLTSHVSRLTSHVSRLTSDVSRQTSHRPLTSHA